MDDVMDDVDVIDAVMDDVMDAVMDAATSMSPFQRDRTAGNPMPDRS